MKEVGTVIEALRGIKFRVEFPSGVVICYLSGRMQQNHITLLVGDKVEVDGIQPDRSNGRIIKRL